MEANYLDFSQYPRSKAIYNTGNAGRKEGIEIDGTNWLIKFSQRFNSNGTRNSSYTNSPLGEYLGSHIYEILKIPVHQTELGVHVDRLVVACKDFRQTGDQLAEFKGIVSSYPGSEDYVQDQGSGNGTVLSNVLEVIDNAFPLTEVAGVNNRFWDMFIVDALIGNSDRNNTNWGITLDSKGEYSLAPVYDNGRAFGERFLVQEYDLTFESLITKKAQLDYQCNYLDDQNNYIKPFDFITKHINAECDKALDRLTPMLAVNQIIDFIHNIPNQLGSVEVVSENDKQLFIGLIEIRAEILKS